MPQFELGEEPQYRQTKYIRASSLSFWSTGTLYAQAISLPCSVGLTAADQSRVIETIASLIGKHDFPTRVR